MACAFLASAAEAVTGLLTYSPPCGTRLPFHLAQVRKPGAAVVVTVQALPELEPDVAQLGGAWGTAADAEYKCPQCAAFGEAEVAQPVGQTGYAERGHSPSGIRAFLAECQCFLPSRQQGPRGDAPCRPLKKVRLMRYGLSTMSSCILI